MTEQSNEVLLRALEEAGVRYVVIGAQAAVIHGAPVVTRDLDVTPARDGENLERLAAALRVLDARLRVPNDPEGVPFPIDPQMLASSVAWTVTTRAGDLDLVFEPAGTRGYDDLRQDATQVEVGPGLVVPVASLVDVIRCKQASGRPKDQAHLPLLRQTLEEIRRREAEERRQS